MEDGRLAAGPPILEQLTHAEICRLVQQLDLVQKVVRGVAQMNTMDGYTGRLDFLVRRKWRFLRDDVDLDSARGELMRQLAYMRRNASDDSGRVFPTEHDDAHALSLQRSPRFALSKLPRAAVTTLSSGSL